MIFENKNGEKKKEKTNRYSRLSLKKMNTMMDEQKEQIGSNISTHKFERNLYFPSKGCVKISAESISQWAETHNMNIRAGYHESITSPTVKRKRRDNDLPPPIFNVDDVQWPNAERVAENFKKSFDGPTPMQSATWPLLLSGLNVIGITRSGADERWAYLLPAIVHMRAQPFFSNNPQVLIIVPNEHSSLQIAAQIDTFASGVKYICLHGGAAAPSKSRLEKIQQEGVEIIVATPRRLLECMVHKLINIGKV